MKVPIIKNGFYGRYGFEDGSYCLEDYSYDKKMPMTKAVEARGAIMRAALSDKLNVLEAPGINIWKQVEMYSKYRKHLPLDVWEDQLYVKPADNILEAVKEEKLMRNAFRIELNKDKKMAAKDSVVLSTVELSTVVLAKEFPCVGLKREFRLALNEGQLKLDPKLPIWKRERLDGIVGEIIDPDWSPNSSSLKSSTSDNGETSLLL
jgi:hypothetical protein